MTTAEAAQFIPVSPRTIDTWCNAGMLPACHLNGKRDIAPHDLALFINRYGAAVPPALARLAGLPDGDSDAS